MSLIKRYIIPGNVSRIMKTCREKNYSNSCNVYTNPEDDSIFFCMKTKGVSQCINILCNSTFKRNTDMNALERIDTDILSPSCMYKYATMEFKDCVTNSSDAGNTVFAIMCVQVFHSCIVIRKLSC